MRNLIVHQQRRRSLQCMKDATGNNHQLSGIQCAVNANNDDVYILLDEKLFTLPIDYERNMSILNITKYSNSKIVGLEYCLTTQELYCAYNTGDIARIDVASESYFEYEIAAKFNDGLQCMKLSPDHEIIVAVTGTGTVITMVSDFQVISEVNLYLLEFGEKQFITVGWGKKDTQFHGSEGKTAAKAKPEQVNASESDDGQPRITWRGDATMFAVSFLHAVTRIREFKVFSREGVLQYTSEPTNGLEECLAWKPSGSLIATTQRLVNKHIVVLFEKNGLKHREFSLPFEPNEVMVKDLFWSPNSDVLAIACQRRETSSMILQLWTENNYHWYLKQTITFSTNNPLIYATWSTTGRHYQKELILLTSREIIFCSYNWCVNRSRGKTTNDKAIIGVIDGKKTLVTGFRMGIVPPPMAHQTLQTWESVNAIVFAPSVDSTSSWINSNVFCTISCDNSFTFYKQVMDSLTLEYKVLKLYKIANNTIGIDERDIYTIHHVLWLAENIMLCSQTVNNRNLLCVLSLDEINSEENDRLTIKSTHVMNGPIEHIISSPDADTAYIVVNNRVLKYTMNTGLDPMDIELQQPCYQVEAIKIDLEHVIIALSCTNCFLINGREVANNITSFYVHSEFLLLTTLQHTLICVPLNKTGMEQLSKYDLKIKPWKTGINEKLLADINIRRIERGSYIITALSQDSRTILQMPRGNLECIQPRALSLHIIKFYLDSCNYLTAFDVMRKQRINLNLIYDHDPELFANNVQKFVEDIANPNWLSLFLSELQNEDVTTTMYSSSYRDRSIRSETISPFENDENIIETKIDKICGILRDVMEKQHDANNLIQPILIAMVKNQQTSGLELALKRIKEIKVMEDSQKSPTHYLSPISSEEALKYLLYLVDINILYDTALGMYDFELTMFVASKSQKDPKEYLPFLNNLKRMDENHMKYSIDMQLKRYESALKHISRVPSKFEECLDLIRNQSLYTRAIKLFEKDSTQYKRVTEIFGEYLLSKKMYQEAAIMFYKCGDFNRALNAYMLAGSWQDVIIISVKMKLSSADLREVYSKLVERLRTDQNYKDAAKILRYYLNDAEEAVALLCEGRCWKHAIRIAQDVHRLDLNDTHIIPGINDHAEHVISRLLKLKEDFVKHKSRLAVVRTEIKKKQTNVSASNATVHNDESASKEVTDFLSDTTSVAGSISSQKSRMSTASGKSYRSSKNRRKQERKLFSLKEGTMFEDLGLIHALYQIITSAYKDRDEWFELVQVLIHFEFDECAEAIQNEIDSFFKLIKNSRSEIWNKSAPTSLIEIEQIATSTPTQFQEVAAYLKAVEPYITHPPSEDNKASRILDIF